MCERHVENPIALHCLLESVILLLKVRVQGFDFNCALKRNGIRTECKAYVGRADRYKYLGGVWRLSAAERSISISGGSGTSVVSYKHTSVKLYVMLTFYLGTLVRVGRVCLWVLLSMIFRQSTTTTQRQATWPLPKMSVSEPRPRPETDEMSKNFGNLPHHNTSPIFPIPSRL